MTRFRVAVPFLTTILAAVSCSAASAAGPDFSLEVRPILSGHCFKCHGPDDKAREAGLRLDNLKSATAKLESGDTAIVPGKPADSELIERINSTDEEVQMPPKDANKPLSDHEKKTLRDWIAAGAEYKTHWAFLPPKQAPLPKVHQSDWPKNAIDNFILARLEAENLHPAPVADRYTLVRRVYLDLVGYPPTAEEADAFIDDPAPNAYEKLVDRLLASPHYGERWARRWLDLARYADTNGFEKDRPRGVWPYRDWVIEALNADLPFDQFSVQQLAGDMLPNATVDQRIATGFHRNTMLNEEGGNDPQEFRYYSLVDRVNVTSTVWLGLTVGCANCHTHKFDPIPHADYFRLMAFLNNADEPTMDIPRADLAKQRKDIETKIAALEADLPNRFPLESNLEWELVTGAALVSAAGATAERLPDGSFRLSGTDPEKDTYTITFQSGADRVAAIRVEALSDPALPSKGPGRTPHGNFVLSEIGVTIEPKLQDSNNSEPSPPGRGQGEGSKVKPDAPHLKPLPKGEGAGKGPQAVKIIRAEADAEQQGFPAAHAIDGNQATGWAIQMPGEWNVNRAATFYFERPQGVPTGAKWTVKLDQQYGGHHTLGRVRLQLGLTAQSANGKISDESARRRQYRDRRFNEWFSQESQHAGNWRILPPAEVHGNVPALSIEPEGVVLVGGDKSKHEESTVVLRGDLAGVTALRLEVLPDPRLPNGGPGRIDYEGPFGDFFLSEFQAFVGDAQIRFKSATQSYAKNGSSAAQAIDGDFQSGWDIDGGVGRRHVAVFVLEKPLGKIDSLKLKLTCDKYYAAGIGKFRIWATNDVKPADARELPGEFEPLVRMPVDKLSADERAKLMQYFCSIAPELSAQQVGIKKLREQLPKYNTTLVMQERRPDQIRLTFVHKRGEYLRPTDPVTPEVLSIFPPLPKDQPHNRLALAQWLVSGDNPLVGRVAINRQWQAIFGRGIVRTTEDFGYQGDPPTHPELLDWLAVEFMNQGWSMKKMLKLIVMSATYQQSSAVTPELMAADPQNRLLARAPRIRMEAEMVRDSLLRASGLLSSKMGGPSVFPPQPPSITTEAAYGSLAWNVSSGEDRYRRGLYTFAKRSAPYAMFNTFDAPSGETCLVRREVSNTPLQALTLQNDVVAIEVAQSLGKQLAAESGDLDARLVSLFRRCLTRPPSAKELALSKTFYSAQEDRLKHGNLDAAKINGDTETGRGLSPFSQSSEKKGTVPLRATPTDQTARAAWTLTARAIINLDETVTKE